MSIQTPKTTYLRDYTPPAYRIATVDLRFELEEDGATVHARLRKGWQSFSITFVITWR